MPARSTRATGAPATSRRSGPARIRTAAPPRRYPIPPTAARAPPPVSSACSPCSWLERPAEVHVGEEAERGGRLRPRSPVDLADRDVVARGRHVRPPAQVRLEEQAAPEVDDVEDAGADAVGGVGDAGVEVGARGLEAVCLELDQHVQVVGEAEADAEAGGPRDVEAHLRAALG